jgi:hypothetical protein
MTKLLEEAIEKASQLSADEQDMVADVVLSAIAEPVALDDETRAAIQEGRAQARRAEVNL